MKKGLSLFLCFLPLVLYVIVCVPLLIASTMAELGYDIGVPLALVLLLGAVILVVVVYGVMFWLIYKTIKNPNLDTTSKVLWGIILYMLNVVAFPIYWFVFIKKEY